MSDRELHILAGSACPTNASGSRSDAVLLVLNVTPEDVMNSLWSHRRKHAVRGRRAPLVALGLCLVVAGIVAGVRLLAVGPTLSPLSLTVLGTLVTQNFDTLASTATSNIVPV